MPLFASRKGDSAGFSQQLWTFGHLPSTTRPYCRIYLPHIPSIFHKHLALCHLVDVIVDTMLSGHII